MKDIWRGIQYELPKSSVSRILFAKNKGFFNEKPKLRLGPGVGGLLSPLEKNYKLKNYSLFQIQIDLSNIKVCTDCPYTDAGVRVLTLTNYGLKIPLSSSVLYQKSSLIEAWFPFSSTTLLIPLISPSPSTQTSSTRSYRVTYNNIDSFFTVLLFFPIFCVNPFNIECLAIIGYNQHYNC